MSNDQEPEVWLGPLMTEEEIARSRNAEAEIWAEWHEKRIGRHIHIACGTLLALIMGFNAWLIWLIWFS